MKSSSKSLISLVAAFIIFAILYFGLSKIKFGPGSLMPLYFGFVIIIAPALLWALYALRK